MCVRLDLYTLWMWLSSCLCDCICVHCYCQCAHPCELVVCTRLCTRLDCVHPCRYCSCYCLCTLVCVHLLLCRLVVTLCEHRRIKCCLRICAVHVVSRCLSVSLLVDFVYMYVTCVQDMCECLLFPRLISHPSVCVLWMKCDCECCSTVHVSVVYFDYLCYLDTVTCSVVLFHCLSWSFVWLVLFDTRLLVTYSGLKRHPVGPSGNRGCHSPEAVHLW